MILGHQYSNQFLQPPQKKEWEKALAAFCGSCVAAFKDARRITAFLLSPNLHDRESGPRLWVA